MFGRPAVRSAEGTRGHEGWRRRHFIGAPAAPYCEALDSKLGELGDHATWVNIWEDPQAEARESPSTTATRPSPHRGYRRHPLCGR